MLIGFIMKFNTRNLLTLVIVATTVLFLIDAGVYADKARKRHRRRSKRTHDGKPRRHEKSGRNNMNSDPVVEKPETSSFISLVESQKDKYLKPKAEKIKSKAKLQPSLFERYSKQKKLAKAVEKQEKKSDDNTTVLPLIKAKLNFFLSRENSEYVYDPSATTTISGISSSELGLQPVYSSNGNYGLHSEAGNVLGRVIHISDAGRTKSHFGCGNAIANLEEIQNTDDKWIALIARGHCSFFTKIKLAERNNASAVLIYDNQKEKEPLPKMFTLGTNIVSVVIKKHDGHKVAKLAGRNKKLLVNVVVNTDPYVATAATFEMQRDIPKDNGATSAFQMQNDIPTENGAISNNGVSIITILTTLLSVVYYQLAVTL